MLIPAKHLPYFPYADGHVGSNNEEDVVVETQVQATTIIETQSTFKKRKSVKPLEVVGSRKPRCPKKISPPLANQKSITTFLQVK